MTGYSPDLTFTAFVNNAVWIDPLVYLDWLAGRPLVETVTRRLASLFSQASTDSVPPIANLYTPGLALALGSIPTNSPSPNLVNVSSSLMQHPIHARSSMKRIGSLTAKPRNSFQADPGPPHPLHINTYASPSSSNKLTRRGSILFRDVRRAIGNISSPLSWISPATSTASTSTNILKPSNSASTAQNQLFNYATYSDAFYSSTSSSLPDSRLPPSAAYAVHLHVVHQYRIFVHAYSYLQRPIHFLTQIVIAIPVPVRTRMIRAYYSFNELVMRELIGKKLNSRTRHDLDLWVLSQMGQVLGSTESATGPASEQLAEPIPSPSGVGVLAARRMLENLKRILKRTEDVHEGEPVVTVLCSEFCLDDKLARRYAVIHFYASHRIDTSKRKLQHYVYSDLEYAGMSILQTWMRYPSTDPSIDPCKEGEGSIVEESDGVDALTALGSELREIKTVNGPKLDLVKQAVVLKLSNPGLGIQIRSLIRHLITLSSSLSQSTSRRLLIIHIIEWVVEPSYVQQWTAVQLDSILQTIGGIFTTGDFVSIKAAGAWSRFVDGVRMASVRFLERRTGHSDNGAVVSIELDPLEIVGNLEGDVQ